MLELCDCISNVRDVLIRVSDIVQIFTVSGKKKKMQRHDRTLAL